MASEALALPARSGAWQRLARWVAALRGWRALTLALLLGGLAALALPPIYAVPLLLPAFVGLVWLLDGARRPWSSFIRGWAFGFAYFLVGLYWVGIAFLVEAEVFGAIMPFAVAGLAAGLALFVGGATWLARLLPWRGPGRIGLLAAGWLIGEALRAWLFTGFPWNLIGSVWGFSDAMLQSVSLFGVWGLSLLTVAAAAAPAALTPRVERRGVAVAVSVPLLLAAVFLFGLWRLEGAPPPGSDRVEGVHLRLVQASIPQKLKWAREFRVRHVAEQLRLTRLPTERPFTHVIWPETAVPFHLERSKELREALGKALPEGGLLVTGAPRSTPQGVEPAAIWNSLHAVAPDGEIVASYDKAHLVPFGEYVPFRALLSGTKLTTGSIDFTPGPGRVALELAGLPPASPLICYEIIFPGRVLPEGERPKWLLNLTNDAWFGNSSGPYQHFAMARMRSVEEGLPTIRVANNGITAAIDAYGRVIGRIGLNVRGVLDVDLPRPLPELTPFARLGNWWLAILLPLALGLSLGLSRRSV
jgi:apolipoprotein N-acyltransferase